MWILSADIGGTKIALAISNRESPERLIKKLILQSPQQEEALFQAIVDGFTKLLENEKGDVVKVSVGLPGILNIEQGIVIHQQNLPWQDYPLVANLQRVYPNATIHMLTDMMTAAIGEYKVRSFTEETLIYMTVSTGISSFTIHQGEFLRGAGIAGEVGFSYTTTGNYFEEQCAGPGLQKALQQATGEDLKLPEFLRKYYANDEAVKPVIEQWQTEVALKLQSFILLIDPHVVVLGGGVMNHHPQLVKEIAKKVDDYFALPFFTHKKGRVQASINKGDAGLIGAAII